MAGGNQKFGKRGTKQFLPDELKIISCAVHIETFTLPFASELTSYIIKYLPELEVGLAFSLLITPALAHLHFVHVSKLTEGANNLMRNEASTPDHFAASKIQRYRRAFYIMANNLGKTETLYPVYLEKPF